jgi:hypothetical protein
MNNADLVNKFYEFWNSNKSTVKEGNTLIVGDATQKDKPSPHSSFTTYELWKRIRKSFPEDNFKVYDVANTNSMEPLFDDNCQVLMEAVTPECVAKQPLTAGDIVVYANNGNLIIHRLLESRMLGSKCWLIGGDNNFMPDGWVPENRIKYRLVGILCGKANRPDD